MRRGSVALGLAALALLLGRPAHAECGAPLRDACINADAYWPHPGPMPLATIGSAETGADGRITFGLVTSYAYRPLVIQAPQAGPTPVAVDAIHHLVVENVLASYGLTDRVALTLALPFTIDQEGAGMTPLGGDSLPSSGLRDPRLGVALLLLRRTHLALGLRSEFSLPVGDTNAFAGERTVVWAPSVSGEVHGGRWLGAIELGARVRPVGESAGARIGTQAHIALGGSVDLLSPQLLRIGLEVSALPTFAAQAADGLGTDPGTGSSPLVPIEWLGSIRTVPPFARDVSVSLGAGTAVPLFGTAATAPRFRGVLAIVVAPH